MAIGPGKYDALCTEAREAAKAQAALLIILGGSLGSGFSCQALGGPMETLRMIAILQATVEQLLASVHEGAS